MLLLSVAAHSAIGPVAEFLLEDEEFKSQVHTICLYVCPQHPWVGQPLIFTTHMADRTI